MYELKRIPNAQYMPPVQLSDDQQLTVPVGAGDTIKFGATRECDVKVGKGLHATLTVNQSGEMTLTYFGEPPYSLRIVGNRSSITMSKNDTYQLLPLEGLHFCRHAAVNKCYKVFPIGTVTDKPSNPTISDIPVQEEPLPTNNRLAVFFDSPQGRQASIDHQNHIRKLQTNNAKAKRKRDAAAAERERIIANGDPLGDVFDVGYQPRGGRERQCEKCHQRLAEGACRVSEKRHTFIRPGEWEHKTVFWHSTCLRLEGAPDAADAGGGDAEAPVNLGRGGRRPGRRASTLEHFIRRKFHGFDDLRDVDQVYLRSLLVAP